MSADSPWIPKATCDATCVSAGAAPSGRAVVVALRVAVRPLAVTLLLAGTLPLCRDDRTSSAATAG